MKKETLAMEYDKLVADAVKLGLLVALEKTRQGQFKSCTLVFPSGCKVQILNFQVARHWVTNYRQIKAAMRAP